MAHTSAKDKLYSKHNDAGTPQDRMSQLIARMKANPRQAGLAQMLEQAQARRTGVNVPASPSPGSSVGGGTTLAQARAAGSAKRGRAIVPLITMLMFLIILIIGVLSGHGTKNSTIPTTAPASTSALSTSTSTTTTTVPTSVTTTVPSSGGNPTSSYGTSCGDFVLSTSQLDARPNATCSWGGGTLNVYEGAGDSGALSFTITGDRDGATYAQSLSNTNYCNALYVSTYFPAQSYTISMHTGRGGGFCGNAFVALNAS